MNPVRKLVDDLIEKRLWPVALMLLVAAFAVPMLIGGGGDAGSDTPDPSFAPAPADADPTTSAVELVGPPTVRTRAGAVRDPFRRAKIVVTDPSGSASAGSAKAAKSSGSGKTGSTKSGSTKSAAAKSTPKATPAVDPVAVSAARSAYQTVVRFTRPGGTRERPLARLAVLGNSASPALQYAGVSSDGKRAIFVLGAKATASGDGDCVADPCRAVGLRRGDKLSVDVVGADAVVRRYVVEITVLRRLSMRTADRASAWRKRVDPVGSAVRETLKQDPATASVLEQLRYATSTGTVRLITAP